MIETLIEWINAEIGQLRNYHNQKENTAWAATAFYWAAIVVLSATVGRTIPNSWRVPGHILVVALSIEPGLGLKFKITEDVDNLIKKLKG